MTYRDPPAVWHALVLVLALTFSSPLSMSLVEDIIDGVAGGVEDVIDGFKTAIAGAETAFVGAHEGVRQQDKRADFTCQLERIAFVVVLISLTLIPSALGCASHRRWTRTRMLLSLPATW